MALAPTLTTTFLLVATLCILLPQAHAFGAGDIPDFAFLNDKAFRHGDIENVLETLAKTAGSTSIGGSDLLGLASSVIKAASGPSKFNRNDIKRVYFGNWARDFSQAMDIAGLSKLSADTLILVVSVLGFMTFGFATEEFEVTADRLGVYLPVEHIDNPKGYAEKEGDARSFHPKLRPPVEPQELEIDTETGMKKYMATENQGWDTSTAFIRRTFQACIEAGRRAGGQEGADLWEAYRLLGTGLHTLEDFTAHSNWCELALRKMGHEEVFCHVGDDVTIDTPNGPAPPIVTGTFGGADFVHSLLGETGDKLSQASVTDLSGKLENASQNPAPNLEALKAILSTVMGDEEQEKLNHGEELKQQAQGYHFDPDNIAPPEVQQQLMDLLRWHDDVMRDLDKKISMVPGLSDLLEEFTNALNEYVYTLLAPYLTPILTQATSALNEGSKVVIDNDDQYEVFNNPEASDPSHSMLSKDHFGLILNEPAGKVARIVVEHTVNLIVQAWHNDEDPNQVIDQILEAFHHPYYSSGNSSIQHKMFEEMEKWIGGLGPDDAAQTIQLLTKESVRDHKNKRLGSEGQSFDEPGYGSSGHGHSSSAAHKSSGGHSATGQGRENYSSAQQYSSHGGGGYGRQSGDEYSSTRYGKEGGDEYSSGRYSERQGRDEDSSGQYARQGGDEYSSSQYDRRGGEEYSSGQSERRGGHEYSSSQYGRQGGDESSSSQYGRQRGDEYSSGQYERQHDSSTYGDREGRSRDETFGVEALNVADEGENTGRRGYYRENEY